MPIWFHKKIKPGWTAVHAEVDSIYAVTVLPPIKTGAKPRVLSCGAVSGNQLDAATLGQLSRLNLLPDCPWTLVLNRKDYGIVVVPEPPVEAIELEQTLRWSISNMIDYPVDEANISWMKIPTVTHQPNRPNHLYVVSAKKELVGTLYEEFEQAGIPLNCIDVREAAQRNIANLLEKPGEGVALLVIGVHGVQFTITFNGQLYLDRFVEESLFTGNELSADARQRASERIVLQVLRSLDFVSRNLPFITINRILLAPMPAALGLNELISQSIPLPVEQLNLSSVFDFSETPALQQEQNQAHYFYALGATLRFSKSGENLSGQQVNLLAGMIPGVESMLIPLAAIAALILVAVTQVSIWFVRQGELAEVARAEKASAQQLKQAEQRLQNLLLKVSDGENLNAEISALKPRAEAARYLIARTADLGSQQGYAHYFDVLTTISENGLWITGVTVGKAGKAMNISGNALRNESVLNYAQHLNAAFANDGVQFTALELAPVALSKQPDKRTAITAVSFRLY